MAENNLEMQFKKLGTVYRILMDAARPEKGANQSELDGAPRRPMAYLGQAFSLAMKLHVITPAMDKRISKLLNDVNVDDIASIKQDQVPMELQGAFLIGYDCGSPYLSKIARYRSDAGLTQTKLAEKIGKSQNDISRWERGDVKPGIDNLKLLADALECKIEDLI